MREENILKVLEKKLQRRIFGPKGEDETFQRGGGLRQGKFMSYTLQEKLLA
jgi:hypothetical protein